MPRLWMSVLVFFFLSRVSFSQMRGDPELLAEIGSKFRDNQDHISSWSAEALIHDETSEDGVITYSRDATLTFVYSRDGDQYRFDMEFSRQNGEEIKANKGEGQLFEYSAIYNKKAYYRYGPIEKNSDKQRVAVRPAPKESVSDGFLGEDFVPFIYTKVQKATTDVSGFTKFYFDNREHVDASKSSVEASDDNRIVVMKTNKPSDLERPYWEYHFSLESAGLPVYVQGGLRSGSDVVSTWKNEFVDIDGVWLPAKHHFTSEEQSTKTGRTRVIEYKNHVLNAPVNEAHFEVASLPFREGDKVFDVDKEEWTRIGMRASDSVNDDSSNKLQAARPFNWWLLLANCVGAIVIAGFFIRKRAKNP